MFLQNSLKIQLVKLLHQYEKYSPHCQECQHETFIPQQPCLIRTHPTEAACQRIRINLFGRFLTYNQRNKRLLTTRTLLLFMPLQKLIEYWSYRNSLVSIERYNFETMSTKSHHYWLRPCLSIQSSFQNYNIVQYHTSNDDDIAS